MFILNSRILNSFKIILNYMIFKDSQYYQNKRNISVHENKKSVHIDTVTIKLSCTVTNKKQ